MNISVCVCVCVCVCVEGGGRIRSVSYMTKYVSEGCSVALECICAMMGIQVYCVLRTGTPYRYKVADAVYFWGI